MWLDENLETLVKGSFKGESIEEVLEEVPEYIDWLLTEASGLESEERKAIEAIKHENLPIKKY